MLNRATLFPFSTSQYLYLANAKPNITMYKSFIASIGAIGLIATTALTNSVPLPALAQPATGSTTQPAAKRVVLTLKAEKKIIETVDNKPKVSYLPTAGKAVKPGDIIRYTVTAKNGNRPVKNLTLTQPMPRGTKYVKNSATTLSGVELLFSIDGGKTYTPKPMVDKKEAPDTAYTNLRWKFTKSIAADAQVTAAYEVQVK